MADELREAVAKQAYIEFQQRRGLMADSILAALEEYRGFMLDDDYNAQGCLDRLVAHLERARPVAEQAHAALSLMQPEIDRRVAEERERLVAVVEAMLATARRGEKTATLETWRHQYKGGIEALEPIVEMLRREAQFEKENSDGE